MTARDTAPQQPGVCTWCGHAPHTGPCRQRIITRDIQLAKCPCAKPASKETP